MTENSAITAYFTKLGKLPLLTREEEQALFEKIEQGDQKARDTLIECNLKLVIPTAKQYIKCGIPFADLIQEGCSAVVHACDKFDRKLGNKFSTYATYWIKQRISRYVKKHFKNVFVPEYVVNLAIQINKAKRSLMQDGIDTPSLDDIYKRLNRDFNVSVTKQDVKDTIESCQSETSMSAKIGDDDDIEFGDLIEDTSTVDPAENIDNESAKDNIESAMASLTDEERFIISIRYGVGNMKMTISEIAKTFGIDEQKVNKIVMTELTAAGINQSEINTLIAA